MPRIERRKWGGAGSGWEAIGFTRCSWRSNRHGERAKRRINLDNAWQKRDKIHRFDFLEFKTGFGSNNAIEHLGSTLANGDDHDAAPPHLCQQRLGDFARGGGGENCIIGGVLVPAPPTITVLQPNIPEVEVLQAASGSLLEGVNPLDGIDPSDQLGEDGGLVPRPRANLKNRI